MGKDEGVWVVEKLVGAMGWGTAKLEHRFASSWEVAVGCTVVCLVRLGKRVRVGVLKVAVSERGLQNFLVMIVLIPAYINSKLVLIPMYTFHS